MCPGSRTDGFYRGRPRWPDDASDDEVRAWQYAEGECDVCLGWVPLEEAPALIGTKQVLSQHTRVSE